MEQLYVEVLYTITNKVGASNNPYYQEDLFAYAQRAFGVTQEQHRRCLAIATEEKVRIRIFFNSNYLFYRMKTCSITCQEKKIRIRYLKLKSPKLKQFNELLLQLKAKETESNMAK
ncbi:hypothetical protein O3M35_011616 [Rhynocoris fuscipes]|uniref:Uncharacterized protein n=1 Tax=Rhynocoris fuscipes TaxID=488301 RepID=A0AAW1CWX3_9HEMI